MMSETPDSETVFAQVTADEFSTEKLTVEGQPRLGDIVEIEYSSDAGGAYASSGTITVRGELMYADIGTEVIGENEGEWDGSFTIVVRDSERERGVSVTLKQDSAGRPTVRSLAAGKTANGRRLGRAERVTFTEFPADSHAPVIKALRNVGSGDTLMVNGDEYGVESAYGVGPERQPSGYVAYLTRPEGGRWTLRASAAYDSPRFSGPDCEYDEYLNLDVSSVQVGRYTERWTDSVRGRENTEDTTDAFPAPHDAREGERVTITLATEDSEETVTGTVTDVRYFTQEEHHLVGGPEEREPETNVELDDGRELILNNDTRHTKIAFRDDDRYDTKAYRALLKSTNADGDSEYTHPLAVDISPTDGEDGDEDGDEDPDGEGGVSLDDVLRKIGVPEEQLDSAREQVKDHFAEQDHDADSDDSGNGDSADGERAADGGRVAFTDGGMDADELAREVADALQDSALAMGRVSIAVSHGDVAVKPNGGISRENWNTLRDTITSILDAEGFQYEAADEWAFVEVVDRGDARADGGGVAGGKSGREDPHGAVKRKLIASDIVRGATSVGEDGQYLAVYRDADATDEELETYRMVMDLAEYVELNKQALPDHTPLVTGDDVATDAWVTKAWYNADDGGDGDV